MELDINSMSSNKCAKILSNLTRKPFIMDGLFFGSIEGFLQGLRVSNENEQVKIFAMHGINAKKIGKTYPIKDQTLYYKGTPFNRHSDKYKELYTNAYNKCFAQNTEFQQALYNTIDMNYTHIIGKTDPFDTILTVNEFIDQLNRLRSEYEKFLNVMYHGNN